MLDSPYRLTALTVAGGLLSALGFLGLDLYPSHSFGPLLMDCFGIAMFCGMIGMYLASYSLQNAVKSDRWSEETLAPYRKVIDHPLWKAAMFLLLIAMFATMPGRHHRSPFWVISLLLQTMGWLNSAFARPKPVPRTGPLLDWSRVSPLSSQHWGER